MLLRSWKLLVSAFVGAVMVLAMLPVPAVAADTEAASGMGTAGISGRVTVPEGSSAADVWVYALGSSAGYWWDFTADVDASGGFTFSNLPAGEYRVTAFDQTGELIGVNTYNRAETLNLESGQSLTDLDVPLVAAASVSGRITAPAGTDFSSLTLTAVTTDRVESRAAVLDASGAYTLGPLRPGTYDMVLEHGRDWGSQRSLPATDGTGQLTVTAGQAITGRDLALEAGEPLDRPASLAGDHRISGRIEAPAGTVDFSGVEIGVHYVYGPDDRLHHFSAYARIKPNSQGEFALPEISAGRYALTLLDRNGHLAEIRRYPASGMLTVGSGQNLDGLRLPMEPGARIRGRITAPAPATPDGVTITVWNRDTGEIFREGLPVAPDGSFSITGLAAGHYSLSLRPGNTGLLDARFPSGYSGPQIIVGTGQTVDVGAVGMELGGSIAGRLTDRNGQPIAGAELTATIIGTSARYQTTGKSGPDGSFTLAGLTPGSYTLKALIQSRTGVAGTSEVLYFGNTKDEAAAARIPVALAKQNNIGELSLAAIPRFTDVPAGSQFWTEIEWLASQGIAQGWPDGSYRPLEPVARDAMAAFIFRQHLPAETMFPAPAASPFADVPPGTQFYREMAWLADRKMSTGWPDNTYRPATSVNRDAMAAFLYRMAGNPDFTPPPVSPFTDVATDNPFYKEITWLADQKITTGWPDKTYRPLAPVNRDAMAAFLYRYTTQRS